jgi:hypothetical protein
VAYRALVGASSGFSSTYNLFDVIVVPHLHVVCQWARMAPLHHGLANLGPSGVKMAGHGCGYVAIPPSPRAQFIGMATWDAADLHALLVPGTGDTPV